MHLLSVINKNIYIIRKNRRLSKKLNSYILKYEYINEDLI